MTLSVYLQDPWKNNHGTYKRSILSISPAPEYANSEVLLAALCRTIGFRSLSEGSVSQAGRDLDRKVQKLRNKSSKGPEAASVDVDTWNTLLHGVLESPKLPNQSSKRFIQITPLVPRASIFSGAARLTANPWPPGSLIRRMVLLGSRDRGEAEVLWKDLFSALSVNGGEDVFAEWLDQEVAAWEDADWQFVPLPESESGQLPSEDLSLLRFMPARQFTKDLRSIIQAKDSMTRRQWTSLLESMLRLASVAHVTWLCDVQSRIWNCLSEALRMDGPQDEDAARQAVFPRDARYMTYGAAALPRLKDKASGYLAGRLGINMVLWALAEANAPYDGDMSSSRGIARLCQHVREHNDALVRLGAREKFLSLCESEARALGCTKGIGKNLLEFARHVLGQRQTAAQLLKGYDQGYVLKKKGSSPSSPWIVSLGPVAVLALVHCALHGMGGPRSIHTLGQHLEAYGVAVDRHDIARNDLGHQLRMLGLVLDSPDAESGMLLLPPFPTTQAMAE